MSIKRYIDVPVDDSFERNPRQWLAEQAQDGMDLLLAHADDGVIWGKVESGTLRLAGDVFAELEVELRATTLQQARLFGPTGELLVWRNGKRFVARLIADGKDKPDGALEAEPNWLWGDHALEAKDGFTLLEEGRQGLCHAPPIGGLTEGQRATLWVRHYLDFDDEDQAHIALSRLVGLTVTEGE